MNIKNLFKKLFSKKISLLVLAVAIISGGFFISNAFADSGVNIITASGGGAVSIDKTSHPSCVGSPCGEFTALTGPKIEETVAGQIGIGTYTLTLPTGWEFNTAVNVSVGTTGTGTGFSVDNSAVFPTQNTLSFTVNSVSTSAPDGINLGGIFVRPTGTVAPTSGNITMSFGSGAGMSGVDSNTNFGTLSTVVGVVTQVRVETEADGTGVITPSQSITADDSVTAYSITRDQFGNFVENATAEWSLESETGLVDDSDLDSSVPGQAIFNGHLIGSAIMRATLGVLSGDSGIITVTPGAPYSLSISREPAGTNSVDVPLTTQPIINVQDQHGNNVPGQTVTAVLVSGTGFLTGTLAATTDVNGDAEFNDLGYSKSGEVFTIKFTTPTAESSASSAVGPLTVGAIHDLTISPASSTITADDTQTYTASGIDQYGNALPDQTDLTTFSITPGAGGSFADNVYNPEFVGTWTVTGTSDSVLTVTDTAELIVTPGAPYSLSISREPAGTNSVDVPLTTQPIINVQDQHGNNVPGQTVTASLNSGTGTLLGTLTATTDAAGDATFTNLGYTKSGEEFKIDFTVDALIITSAAVGPLAPGAPATIEITTQPAGTNSVDVPLTTQPIINVQDQHGNNVPGQTVTAVLVSGTGFLTGTLAATTDVNGDAEFNDLGYSKSGEVFTIKFTTPTAESSASSAVGPLTVGAIHDLTISPASSTITADDTQTYTASGIDQYGNALPDQTDLTTFSITPGAGGSFADNVYNPEFVGTWTVTGTSDSVLTVTDTAELIVTPGAPYSLSISREPAGTNSVDVPLTTQPIINVQDQHGNNVPGQTVTASLNSGTGTLLGTLTATTDAAGDATFTNLGYTKSGEEFKIDFTVDALIITSAAVGPLTVGAIHDLTISPASSTITADDTQTYTASGIDQYGNALPDQTDLTTFSITPGAGGSFADNVYNPEFVGTWTVTGTSDSVLTVTDTAELIVTPGVITHLDINASPDNLPVNTNSLITVKAHDRFSNIVTYDNTTRILLNVDNGNLAAAGLTLTAGVATTTLTNSVSNITLVSVIDLTNTTILDDETTVTFTAIGAPVITSISEQDISQSGAVINFTSDRAGKSRIDYGTTTSYGFSTQYPATNNMTADSNNNITLGGLNCGTIYYYKIFAKSVSDVEGTSEGSFDTLSCPVVVIPTIDAPTAGSTVSGSVSIDTTNGIEYQIDGGVWVNTEIAWDTTLVVNGSHTIRVKGGEPTEYSDTITVIVNNHETEAPTVSSWTPGNEATDVKVNIGINVGQSDVSITFSEAMDVTTLTTDNIRLIKESDDSVIELNTIVDDGDLVVHLIPTANLEYNTNYYLVVENAKDLAGNSIEAYGSSTTTSFTTESEPTGELAIGTAVMIKSDGLADNSYANGWEWKLRITLPINERAVALKFADWVSGSNILAAANNMRYYSEQITSGTGSSGTPVEITAANTYPSDIIIINDADLNVAGIQTDIHIQVKIPATTVGGAYSSAFAVKSSPDGE